MEVFHVLRRVSGKKNISRGLLTPFSLCDKLKRKERFKMDEQRFLLACERVVGKAYERDTVGLLSEKTMHATLKEYFEADHTFHEIKVGAFYADILRANEITEIQTRSLCNLRKKLDLFLKDYAVTVVYPIPYGKNLIWLDRESGETSEKKRVGKKGSFFDAGRELWYLSDYLLHPRLSVRLLLIDVDEYRFLNKKGEKKHGTQRHDRIPLALRGELLLEGRESFYALLPKNLPLPFTAKEFRKAVKGGPRTAPALLSVLMRVGVVKRVGKTGNAYLYEKV